MSILQNEPWERTCDFCERPYSMNSKIIPRIFISKKIDLDDLTSKDFIASPDFCELCITQILRFIQRKKALTFSVNGNRIISNLTQVMNQSI